MADNTVIPEATGYDSRVANEKAVVALLRIRDNHIARANNMARRILAAVVLDTFVLVPATFMD